MHSGAVKSKITAFLWGLAAVLDRPAMTTPPLPRILLVEDNEALGQIYQMWLTGEGWTVIRVSTVASAEDAARDQAPFDLLIADVGLPDGNGWDLAQHLLPQYGISAAIWMSAIDCRHHAKQGRPIPPEFFISKSASRQAFVDRIRDALPGT